MDTALLRESFIAFGRRIVLLNTLVSLASASTNEVVEVILGGSIVIPAAFVFFGPVNIQSIARSGVFNLGFVTTPLVLNKLSLAAIFGFIWFFLLFLAGITSLISLAQPAVAFLEDEFDISRKKAVLIFGIVSFILCQPTIFFLKNGVVDELDFWGGTFFLVLFATIETILFAWVFGMEKAWDEIHKGADMRVPKIYKFIIKYITPLFLLSILVSYFWQKESRDLMFMKNIYPPNKIFILDTRLGLAAVFLILVLLVKIAWRHKRIQSENIR